MAVIINDSMNVKIYSLGPGAKKRIIAPNGANIPVHVEKALSITGPNDINNTNTIKKEKINPTNVFSDITMSNIVKEYIFFDIVNIH